MSTNTGEGPHEVVIDGEDGLDEGHAQMLRQRLLADGFHAHAVSVRERSQREENHGE